MHNPQPVLGRDGVASVVLYILKHCVLPLYKAAIVPNIA